MDQVINSGISERSYSRPDTHPQPKQDIGTSNVTKRGKRDETGTEASQAFWFVGKCCNQLLSIQTLLSWRDARVVAE